MENLKAEKSQKEEIEKIKADFTNDYLKAIIGNWKEREKAYFVKSEEGYKNCPNCTNGKTTAILTNGKKATVQCDFCNGRGLQGIGKKNISYEYVEDLALYVNKGKPFLGFQTRYRVCNLANYTHDKEKLVTQIKEYNDKQDNELKQRYEQYKKNNV